MFGPDAPFIGPVAWWAIGGLVVGALLGVAFPKATTCVCFPFSFFGVS